MNKTALAFSKGFAEVNNHQEISLCDPKPTPLKFGKNTRSLSPAVKSQFQDSADGAGQRTPQSMLN